MELLSAAGAVRRGGSLHGVRAGDRQQLAGVHALVDAQLAAVLQHAQRDAGDVPGVVESGVRAALVLQAQLLQHGAQLGLGARDLEGRRGLMQQHEKSNNSNLPLGGATSTVCRCS